MNVIRQPFEVEATLDRATGGFSLGPKPKILKPETADFEIPAEEPKANTNPEIVDQAGRVRRSLFAIMEAEEGLESLRMAEFLRNLTNEQRQSLYEDVFMHAANFSWLLCVPPKAEEEVIREITKILAMPNKHTSEFRAKRRALEQKLERVIGDRYQMRNNARYVRANPDAIRTYKNPNGREVVTDENYYREQLNRTAL